MAKMNVCGVECEVESVSGGFARGPDGRCAFCHGDPCAERSDKDSPIYRYMRDENGKWNGWASTCPCCEGRPT